MAVFYKDATLSIMSYLLWALHSVAVLICHNFIYYACCRRRKALIPTQQFILLRSLNLYPLPDLVVIADKFEPFAAEHLECKVINPGKFLHMEKIS